MRCQRVLCLGTVVCLLVTGCARLARLRTAAADWQVYTLCATEDGSKLALAAILGYPLEPGASHMMLAMDISSGAILYRRVDPVVRDTPLQWLRDGPWVLVGRSALTKSGQPPSGVFALNTLTGEMASPVPTAGLEMNARWTPDWSQVIFERMPVRSQGPPVLLRKGPPDVYATGDGGEARLIASHASLVAVAPVKTESGYRVLVRRRDRGRDRGLAGVIVPGGKEEWILPPSLGTTGGYSVAVSGRYAAGLGWREDMKGASLLAIRDLGEEGKPTLTEIPAYVTHTSWAPDAGALACFGSGGLWIYDVKSGKTSRLGSDRLQPRACVWLPGSKQLVVANGPDVLLVNRETGSCRRLYRAGGGDP